METDLSLQQCCGSGMFIPDPGSWFLSIPDPGSRIPDPGSKNSNKRQGWKFFFFKPFFVATNFTKLNIILFLICWRKKFGPIFQELLKFLPKKLSPSPQKYGFGIRDRGSEIRDPKKNLFRIPDPGVKKAPDPGSGSATLRSKNPPVARGLILLPLSPSLQLGGCRLNHNILLHTRRRLLLLEHQQGLPFPVAATCRKWGGVRSATVQLEQVVVGKPVVTQLTHENGRTLFLNDPENNRGIP